MLVFETGPSDLGMGRCREAYEPMSSARVEAREHSMPLAKTLTRLGTLPAGTNPELSAVLITAEREPQPCWYAHSRITATFSSGAIRSGRTICSAQVQARPARTSIPQPNGEHGLTPHSGPVVPSERRCHSCGRSHTYIPYPANTQWHLGRIYANQLCASAVWRPLE